MSLVLNNTYNGVFYDVALDGVRDLLISEFKHGKIYIAPERLYTEPFQVQIWGVSAETERLVSDQWQKQYNILISLHLFEQNPSEKFYRQLWNDAERIYQVLFNNTEYSKTVSSTTFTWLDGNPETMEFEKGEDEDENFYTINIEFNCKIFR